jgi:hypothetical protein
LLKHGLTAVSSSAVTSILLSWFLLLSTIQVL